VSERITGTETTIVVPPRFDDFDPVRYSHNSSAEDDFGLAFLRNAIGYFAERAGRKPWNWATRRRGAR
jgi:hypothetical protein